MARSWLIERTEEKKCKNGIFYIEGEKIAFFITVEVRSNIKAACKQLREHKTWKRPLLLQLIYLP